MATRLRSGWSGVRIPVGIRDFIFSKTSTPALGPAQHPSAGVKVVPRLRVELYLNGVEKEKHLLSLLYFWSVQYDFLKREWKLCLYCACIYRVILILWGHAVAQLVEALRYKPEGRGFDFRWCH
jgi:hypothetical protein